MSKAINLINQLKKKKDYNSNLLTLLDLEKEVVRLEAIIEKGLFLTREAIKQPSIYYAHINVTIEMERTAIQLNELLHKKE